MDSRVLGVLGLGEPTGLPFFLRISIRNGQNQEEGEYKFFLGVIKLLFIARR